MNDTYDPLASVQSAGPPGTISFCYGLPDPETFPVNELQRAFEKVFEERASIALQYGPGQGYGPLIDHLRKKVKRSEGISLARPQIMLSGGLPRLSITCVQFLHAPAISSLLKHRLITIPFTFFGIMGSMCCRSKPMEKG